MKKQAWGCLNK